MTKHTKLKFNFKKMIFWFLDFFTEHLFTSHGTPLFRRT